MCCGLTASAFCGCVRAGKKFCGCGRADIKSCGQADFEFSATCVSRIRCVSRRFAYPANFAFSADYPVTANFNGNNKRQRYSGFTVQSTMTGDYSDFKR